MNRPASVVILALASGALWACSPASDTPASPLAPAQPPASQAAAPARNATMICRNSQDGRSVACGTPNAVMVGIKQN
jgi:hypothetical protein